MSSLAPFTTAAVTIFGGVTIYCLSQLTSKFIIDPIHALKHTIGETQFALHHHAPSILTPGVDTEGAIAAARETLRKCASGLLAQLHAIPYYQGVALAAPGFLPSREKVQEAARNLVGLSNSLHVTDQDKSVAAKNAARVSKISESLGFPDLS